MNTPALAVLRSQRDPDSSLNQWLNDNPLVLVSIILILGILLSYIGIKNWKSGASNDKYEIEYRGRFGKFLALVRILAGVSLCMFAGIKYLTTPEISPIETETIEKLKTNAVSQVRSLAGYRTFTNSEGIKIEAKILSADQNSVTIKRKDGTKFTTPVDIYSEEDQALILEWSEKHTTE